MSYLLGTPDYCCISPGESKTGQQSGAPKGPNQVLHERRTRLYEGCGEEGCAWPEGLASSCPQEVGCQDLGICSQWTAVTARTQILSPHLSVLCQSEPCKKHQKPGGRFALTIYGAEPRLQRESCSQLAAHLLLTLPIQSPPCTMWGGLACTRVDS